MVFSPCGLVLGSDFRFEAGDTSRWETIDRFLPTATDRTGAIIRSNYLDNSTRALS